MSCSLVYVVHVHVHVRVHVRVHVPEAKRVLPSSSLHVLLVLVRHQPSTINLQERVAQEAALSAEIQSLQSALSDQEAARQVEVSGLEHQVKKRHQYLENFSQVCSKRGSGVKLKLKLYTSSPLLTFEVTCSRP